MIHCVTWFFYVCFRAWHKVFVTRISLLLRKKKVGSASVGRHQRHVFLFHVQHKRRLYWVASGRIVQGIEFKRSAYSLLLWCASVWNHVLVPRVHLIRSGRSTDEMISQRICHHEESIWSRSSLRFNLGHSWRGHYIPMAIRGDHNDHGISRLCALHALLLYRYCVLSFWRSSFGRPVFVQGKYLILVQMMNGMGGDHLWWRWHDSLMRWIDFFHLMLLFY